MAGQPAGDQALGVPRSPQLVNLLRALLFFLGTSQPSAAPCATLSLPPIATVVPPIATLPQIKPNFLTEPTMPAHLWSGSSFLPGCDHLEGPPSRRAIHPKYIGVALGVPRLPWLVNLLGGAPFFPPGNLLTVCGTMRTSEALWPVASVVLVTRLAVMASVAG